MSHKIPPPQSRAAQISSSILPPNQSAASFLRNGARRPIPEITIQMTSSPSLSFRVSSQNSKIHQSLEGKLASAKFTRWNITYLKLIRCGDCDYRSDLYKLHFMTCMCVYFFGKYFSGQPHQYLLTRCCECIYIYAYIIYVCLCCCCFVNAEERTCANVITNRYSWSAIG